MARAGRWLTLAAALPLAGQAQTALRFDGVNDYVTMGVAPGLNTSTFTVECWMKRTGTGVAASTGTGGVSAVPLVTKGRGEADSPANFNCNYFMGVTAAGNIVADFESASGGLNSPVTSIGTVANNVWNHVAVTYGAGTWTIFINGAVDRTLTVVGAPVPEFNTIQHFALGSALNSTGTTEGFLQGDLDQVRVWNTVRTPAQMAASYRQVISTATPGLIGNYQLEEGTGLTTANAGSAPGSTTGTLTNGPTWVPGFVDTPAAFTFNGSSQYVTFGVAPGLSSADPIGAFTLECWFYKTGTGVVTSTGTGGVSAAPLVTKGVGQSDSPANLNCNYFMGVTTAGNIVGDFEATGGGLNYPITSFGTVASNAWNHVALTYDGTSWALYINGRLDKTQYAGATPEYNSIQHASIGSALYSTGAPQGYFQGSIDNARIWDVARTSGQIASAYRQVMPTVTTGLLGNYIADNSSASNTGGSANVNGTLINNPTFGPNSTNVPPALAPFTPGGLVVERVGNGGNTTIAPNASAPISLVEYAATGTSQVGRVALMLPASTTENRVTASGSGVAEGQLTLAADGSSLLVTGYSAALNVANIAGTASATTPRTVARVLGNKTVDVSTALTDAFSGNAIHGVASADGGQLLLVGQESSAGGGRLATLGGATSAPLSGTGAAIRAVQVVNGTIYYSTSTGIYSLGPVGAVTASTVPMQLAGVAVAGSSFYSFVVLDRSIAVAGPDALYIADDGTGTGGTANQGIWKFSFNGTTWTPRGRVYAAAAVRGLTGRVNGTSTNFYATTTATSANTLITVADATAYNAAASAGTATTLATAPANTVFRGVAFAPGTPEINLQLTSSSANLASGGSYAFAGTTAVGSAAGSVSFTIQNMATGTAPLVLPASAISLSGTDASDFSVTQTGTTSVAVGGSTTFTVNFAPTTAGQTSTATLSIANSDADENPYTLTLTGTSTAAPTLTVTGTLSAFYTLPGQPSAAQSYQLSGTSLSQPSTVTAPAGFAVSRTNTAGSYGPSIQYTAAELATSQPVYVRLTGATAGTFGGSGNPVTNVHPGANATNPDTPVPASTVVAEPTNSTALSVLVSTLTSASTTLTVGGGNGSQRLLVLRPASAAAVPPTDQTAYTASLTYGLGATTGPDNYVVLDGTASSVTVFGLAPGTSYVAEVYNYNEAAVAGFENYNPSPAPANFTVPASVAFTPGSLVLAVVGNGNTFSTSAAFPVTLREYSPDAATLRQAIALPSANGPAGQNQALTLSGSGGNLAAYEGQLTLAENGQYVTMGGYAAAVGTAAVNTRSATATPRVVARLASDGSANTTTALTNAYTNVDLRSVASSDGGSFYLSGGGSEGPRYAASLGATTSSQVGATTFPEATRFIGIVDGKVILSSNGANAVQQLGTGLSAAPNQARTTLAAVTAPNGFAFLDLDPAIAGADVLYVTTNFTAVAKFSKDASGTWTARGTLSGFASLYNLTATNDGAGVRVYATSPTRLYTFVDGAAYNAPITGTVSILLTAPTNFNFRGVAFAPASPTITAATPTSGPIATEVVLTGTNFTGTTSVAFNGSPLPAAATFVVNSSTQLTLTVPAAASTGANTITVTTPTGTAIFAFTVTTLATAWTGTVSMDWFDAGNWSAGVPTATLDATIGAGATRYPVLSAGTATARTLTLAPSALLTMTGGTLTLQADLLNNGQLTATGGRLIFSGATPQTIGGSATSTFYDLTINTAGAMLGGPVAVQHILTLTGNLATAGQPFTLLSNATGTALVVNSGGRVTGTATVQRAITATLNSGLGYRHYAAPVSGSTVADLTTAGFTPVVNNAYNGAATPGTVTPFPTVFGYDQSRLATVTSNYSAFDKGWVSPASLSEPLAVGRGYTVHLDAGQTVDFVGTLTTGDLAPLTLDRNTGPTANEAGWHLVGNPYPAPLDWSQVNATDRANLDGAMYVFESASPYTGQYRSYTNGIGASPVVALGQAFFVRVADGQTSGSLTFRDSQRLTSEATPTLFYRGGTDTRPQVQLALRGSSGPADALFVYAETGATANLDANFDAAKLPNPSGLNLSALSAGGEALSIAGLPTFTAATVVPLTVAVPATGSYTLHADSLLHLPAGLDAYLVDLLNGQQVNLRQQRTYSFQMSAAQATLPLVNRFVLRFGTAAQPLATAGALTAASVTVYPNPAHNQFQVLLPGVTGAAQVQATLLNALGQEVRRHTAALPATGAGFSIDVTGLASGVYTLRLQAGPATVARRVVVQ